MQLCRFVSTGDPGCCNTSEDCDDGDCATVDYCKPNNQCVSSYPPNQCRSDLDCDDGKECAVDKCVTSGGCGECESEKLPGSICCQFDAQCDDRKPCTADNCPANNKCHSDAIVGCCLDAIDGLTACDDEDACTID